jgi:murein DD-endopeptidase MepM/ murein hydrolase activator NlpD
MLKYLIILIVTLACAQIKPINIISENKKEEVAVSQNDNQSQMSFTSGPIVDRIIKVELQPGKVTFVEFAINLPDGKWELDCEARKIPIVVLKGKARFFMAETYFSDMKPYQCFFEKELETTNLQRELVFNVKVVPFKYKREKLHVDQKKVDLSKKDLERVMREVEITKKIYLDSASYYLFDKPFIKPLESFVTSIYGNKRIFNNKKETQHLGTDFRAAIGIPIPASNKGRVVFTGDLFYAGMVVVLDHGLDIFTMYGHLSEIKVRKGDMVAQGDIVGLSGATGRVSGPHLHWGVKLQGHWVDGLSLVEQSNLKYD